jgi:hypothetical protein
MTRHHPSGRRHVDRLRALDLGELLDAPTLGALRRRDGISPARVRAGVLWLLAGEMVNEARRADCLDHLDQLQRLTAAGASPCAIAHRLRALAHRLHPTGPDEPTRTAQAEAHRAVDTALLAALTHRLQEEAAA